MPIYGNIVGGKPTECVVEGIWAAITIQSVEEESF